MDALSPGRIIWHTYPGDRGDGKRRPMIVASKKTDIARTGRVVVVVCSTSFVPPPSPSEVELPHHPTRPCVTKLREPTVAVCDWTVTLDLAEIKETGGMVGTSLLREICAKSELPFPVER